MSKGSLLCILGKLHQWNVTHTKLEQFNEYEYLHMTTSPIRPARYYDHVVFFLPFWKDSLVPSLY